MSLSAATRIHDLDVHAQLQFSEQLERQGAIYVSRLNAPVVVYVPHATLTTGLSNTFETLSIEDQAVLAKFKEVEQTALDTCIANKEYWFHESVSDEDIANGFKSFVGDGTLRVKVDEEVECYDIGRHRLDQHVEAGESAAVVLSASKISFGKSEFGLVWTLHQLKRLRGCLVPEETSAEQAETEQTNTRSLLARVDAYELEETIDNA